MNSLSLGLPLTPPAVPERTDWGFFMLLTSFLSLGLGTVAIHGKEATVPTSIALMMASVFGYVGKVLFDRIKNSDKVNADQIRELRDDRNRIRQELADFRKEVAARDGMIQGRFDQMSQIISTQQVALAKHELRIIEKDAKIAELQSTIDEQEMLSERLLKRLKQHEPDFLVP